MQLTLLPGAKRDTVLSTFRDLHAQVMNAQSGTTTLDRLLAYFDWANEAGRRLRTIISAVDIDRLVFTRRYELLLNARGSDERVINGLLSAELTERAHALDQALRDLTQQYDHWQRPTGVLAVLDTSVYIHHPNKLEDMDLARLLHVVGGDVHIVVPILVVEELDRLKESKTTSHVRWRAGHTLAVLERVLSSPTTPTPLRPADPYAEGLQLPEVTVEILLDPPGHVRLPINDDEIIDRAASITRFGQPVTLVTYDTSQTMRARAVGLRAVKPPKPRGDDEQTSGKG